MYNTLQTTPRKLQHLIIQHEYARVSNTSTMYIYYHKTNEWSASHVVCL